MAILIDFEGPDCCFKSSIIDQLKEMMRTDEYLSNFEIFSFDNIIYDDPNSYYIKNYLNGKYGDPSELDNTLKMHLQAMSRIDNIVDAAEIFNNDQNIILLDRYTLSNVIYNSKIYSAGERMFPEYLNEINKIINFEHVGLSVPTPDFVVLLQQNKELAKDIMSKKRKDKQDKLESNEYFMDSIYRKYYDPYNVYGINLEDLYNYRDLYDVGSTIYEFIDRMISKYEEHYHEKTLTYPEYYCLYLATLNRSPMFFNKYYCYENDEETEKPTALDLNAICNCILPDIKNLVAYKVAVLLSRGIQTNNMEVF